MRTLITSLPQFHAYLENVANRCTVLLVTQFVINHLTTADYELLADNCCLLWRVST